MAGIRYQVRKAGRKGRCVSKVWIDGSRATIYRLSSRRLIVRWERPDPKRQDLIECPAVWIESKSPVLFSFWNAKGTRIIREIEK